MLGAIVFLFMIVVVVLVISALWTIFTGAPWEPLPLRKVHRMLEMAQLQPGEALYDLGSGDGRTLIIAARRFKARAVGIEIDPLRYVWTQMLITVLGLRKQVRVIWGSFYDADLSDADVVTAFLTEQTNHRLEDKLKTELRDGARVISHEFPYPGWVPAEQDQAAKLFLYRF
jgi:cyclopropane fatty-acyl-phospholipid synthase-like methyltransferase